jgi:hypothetical protein
VNKLISFDSFDQNVMIVDIRRVRQDESSIDESRDQLNDFRLVSTVCVVHDLSGVKK